jgi:hypothetical protein
VNAASPDELSEAAVSNKAREIVAIDAFSRIRRNDPVSSAFQDLLPLMAIKKRPVKGVRLIIILYLIPSKDLLVSGQSQDYKLGYYGVLQS